MQHLEEWPAKEQITYRSSFQHNNQVSKPPARGTHTLTTHVQSLEEFLSAITDEIKNTEHEVEMLENKKNHLKEQLNAKEDSNCFSLNKEIQNVEKEVKRYFQLQKAENSRIQQQIKYLKKEKKTLVSELLSLQNRIEELETQIGN